jgi:hypothetical protein
MNDNDNPKPARGERLAATRSASDVQFSEDLEGILCRLTGIAWPPGPLIMSGRTLSASRAERARLPIGPLKRMTKLVGIASLRHIFQVGDPKSSEFFRLLVRLRLDVEYPHGNHFKEEDRYRTLISFGNYVVEARKAGHPHQPSYLMAASKCKMAKSQRQLERIYSEFRQLCIEISRVPHPLEPFGFLPQFMLDDL